MRRQRNIAPYDKLFHDFCFDGSKRLQNSLINVERQWRSYIGALGQVPPSSGEKGGEEKEREVRRQGMGHVKRR